MAASIWLLAAVILVLGCDGSSRPDRPDLLLITVDTLRADHLGAYGAQAGSSPELDRLAERSVVFERMLAASSRTAPSHASIFSARFARAHSVGFANGSTRLADGATLASRLAAAGYETAAFVSNSMLKRRIGLDQGFAHYDDALPDSEANRPVFERVAPKTTARAIEWLEGPRTRPRFLWVHYNDPHGPYTPPPELVKAAPSRTPESALPALAIDRGLGGIPAYQVIGGERKPSQYSARYAGEIRFLDASIGRLLETFLATATGAGAVVAVTADHGEALGEEGVYFSHGFGTAPNLAHVPFLLFADGLAPRRVAGLVHHVDILPTLLEAAGLPIPEGLDGITLLEIAHGAGRPPADRALFVDVGEEVSVYRDEIFVRARFGPALGVVAAGSRMAYHWLSDESWPASERLPGLERLVDDYAGKRVPLLPAPPLDGEDAERLRALGYAVP